jgi:hypothetical protein
MSGLINSKPNLTALASATGLDLLLIEALTSGTDTANPANNVYTTKNIFLKDFLTAIGLSNNNKIINGDFRIDQRNIGSSITPASGAYTLDRWIAYCDLTGKFSVQQNAAAVTPPTGFLNYAGITSLSSYSIVAGSYYLYSQRVEGLNCSDLNWGAANARPISVSFWVRSSLTGTFGGVIANSGGSKSYPFTYTISLANTWEYKTINILGDTSGTWLTTNSTGFVLHFGLGVGSTYTGAAGSWAAANYLSATGAVSVVGTNAATWYITGVKVETGSIATPFVADDYAVLLAKCQRYFRRLYGSSGFPGMCMSAGRAYTYVNFSEMRVTPTATGPAAGTGVGQMYPWINTSAAPTGTGTNNFIGATKTSCSIDSNGWSGGLVSGGGTIFYFVDATGYIQLDAEL